MFDTIFHPSDFTETSQVAFCHALKLGLLAQAEVKMLHITRGDTNAGLAEFPGVRDMLVRWGLLPEGASRHDVAELGIDLEKVAIRDDDPVTTIHRYLERHPSSLLVMAAHRRDAWFERSDAEPISRDAGVITLFLADGVKGFVSEATGEVRLDNIVFPIALKPNPASAMGAVTRLIELATPQSVNVHVLHLGTGATLPAVRGELSNAANVQVTCHEADDGIVDAIVAFARDASADLVVMPTAGHDGFLDALRGSTTERVLREISCPLLAVTAEWRRRWCACDKSLQTIHTT